MTHQLTDEQLAQLATLAKLNLIDSEKNALRVELAQLLSYVDKISELPTEDVLPLTHFPECVQQLNNSSVASVSGPALREDIPDRPPHPEQFVSLAPQQKDNCYLVPNTFQSS